MECGRCVQMAFRSGTTYYLCNFFVCTHYPQVGVPEATATLFKEKEVDGQVLSLLKEDEFKNEFNTSFGQRKKILMLRDDVVSKGKCMLMVMNLFHYDYTFAPMMPTSFSYYKCASSSSWPY
jgi:hypothetical protein